MMDSTHPTSPRFKRIAALVGGIVAAIGFIVLLLQGTPTTPSIDATVSTRNIHATKSGCRQSCKEPQTTQGEVSVKGQTTGTSGSGGALDRALNNDAGVTVIRLLFALLAGAAIGLATAAFLSNVFPGGSAGTPSQLQSSPKEPEGGDEEGAHPQQEPESAREATARSFTI